MYKRAVSKLHIDGGGNGYTSVVTDSRCNGHITADGAFERPVRLPAAIKGAKLAGAGTDSKVLLINTVEDIYLEVAEDNVIPRAHQRSYIKRLKSKITSISPEDTGVPLTDDSEGEGGDDTSEFILNSLEVLPKFSSCSDFYLPSQRDHVVHILLP